MEGQEFYEGAEYYDVDSTQQNVVPEPEFIEKILETRLPEEIKELLWIVDNKDIALTYLDDGEIKELILGFDVACIFARGAMPRYKITWRYLADEQQARLLFESRVRRSKKGFERKMQATQIQEVKRSVIAPQQSGGFLSWLFRR